MLCLLMIIREQLRPAPRPRDPPLPPRHPALPPPSELQGRAARSPYLRNNRDETQPRTTVNSLLSSSLSLCVPPPLPVIYLSTTHPHPLPLPPQKLLHILCLPLMPSPPPSPLPQTLTLFELLMRVIISTIDTWFLSRDYCAMLC